MWYGTLKNQNDQLDGHFDFSVEYKNLRVECLKAITLRALF